MTIQVYQCADDRRKLNKALTAQRVYTAQLKDDTDVSAPVLLLSAPLPPNYNYVYIPSFGRYYYINDNAIALGKLWEITLSVDVLMSFKAQINLSTVIISRSTNKGNRLLQDNIPLQARRQYVYKAFKGGDLANFGSDKITENTPNYLITTL